MAKPKVSPVELILSKMEDMKARNSRLSQRAFAKRLGVSSGALSEILQGKRTLTHNLKKKIAAGLDFSPQEQMAFFDEDLPEQLRPNREEYTRLSSDQFHLISDWWHFALLNLVNTTGFRPQLGWLSERLGLSVQVIGDAWDRLFRLGFLEKGTGHRVIRKHPKIETSDDLFDLSIRKAHLEDLKLMEHSLLEVPIENRNQSSMTIVLNKKDIAKAKELIRLFANQFSQTIEKNPGEEVYRLTVALYPLTKVTGKR